MLKNYRIYGESVQDGTPAPDNPVEVTGLGVRTANLYNYANDDVDKYINTYGQIVTWHSGTNYVSDKIPVVPGKTYTLIAPLTVYGTEIYAAFYKSDDTALSAINITSPVSPYEKTYTITAPSGASYFRTSIKREVGAQSTTMFIEGSIAPETYIPYGYKLPITVTSNGTTTDYPVYIGDSQLMEGEYVDYEEQKMYKLINGILTPTDPPEPFPDITIPEGEVTIDIDGELKPQATIKGLISPIT